MQTLVTVPARVSSPMKAFVAQPRAGTRAFRAPLPPLREGARNAGPGRSPRPAGVAGQRPLQASALGEASPNVTAWRTIPSWALNGNKEYAAHRYVAGLAMMPSLKTIVIGCADPRVDPTAVLGAEP